jgi:hypothetical protein
MSSLCRFFLVLVLLLWAANSSSAAPAVSCETLQARIEALRTAIKKKTASKARAAAMQAELDSLSRQYTSSCAKQRGRMTIQLPPKGTKSSSPPPVQVQQVQVRQAATPEEEIKRRREAINLKQVPPGGKPAKPVRAGEREIAVSRAVPIDGTIEIKAAAASTLYGAVKQEITYTLRETFVGNLVISRYHDRVAGRYTDREDYAIQSLSTEIDMEQFKGRGCAQSTGSSAACTQWQRFDIWEIVEGDEYPGRSDGVVSAVTSGRSVTVRVDAPDIQFMSSQGPVSLKSSCGDMFRETVSRDEFKQWIRRSKVQMTREVGKNTPGCRPGSTLTLEMRIHPEQ